MDNILRDLAGSCKEPRVPGNTLSCKPGKTKEHSGKSISCASSFGSENEYHSDLDCTIAKSKCMALTKKPRGLRQSLSMIGNAQIAEECSDYQATAEEEDRSNVAEEHARAIIDQEILEWQYVCSTGKPYWWSTGAKFDRMKSHSPRLSAAQPTWHSGIPTEPTPVVQPEKSLLDNPMASRTPTAHKVALELLATCFTLPPSAAMSDSPAPAYTTSSSSTVQDARMVSSLRMHMSYRYSPSFGQNARNASPIEGWSSCESHASASSTTVLDEQMATLKMLTTDAQQQRFSGLRTTTKATASQTEQMMQSQATTDGQYRKAALALLDASTKQSRRSTRQGCTLSVDESAGGSNRNGSDLSLARIPVTKHSLQPVLLSEFHPVFVQTVKDLVVKKWGSIRRSFNDSRRKHRPGEQSDDSVADPFTSISSEGRIRRRRAQESGDIYSSMDNGPPHNSLASSYYGSEAAYTADTAAVPTEDVSNKGEQPAIQSLAIGHLKKNVPKPIAGASETSFASRLRQSRARRTSCLSEVVTPDDLHDAAATTEFDQVCPELSHVRRRGLSTNAAAMNSSEGPSIDATIRKSVMKMTPVRRPRPTSCGAPAPTTTSETSYRSVSNELQNDDGHVPRCSLSGSQIFNTAEEGIEIDGMPTGPSSDAWGSSQGNSIEPAYL